jgi:opacity protein-like surface antigen
VSKILRVVLLSLGAAAAALAQRNEFGISVGAMLSQNSGILPPLTVNLSSGIAFQADYAHRVLTGNNYVALYGDVVVSGNPQRTVSSATGSATRDIMSFFVVPGIRIKFAPKANVSPWFSIGPGYTLYQQSTTSLNGAPNTAPRDLNRIAVGYGGGLDWKVARIVSLRLELRDFYSTGSAAYNVPGISGGQHNYVAGGGFVLRFD